MDMSNSTSITPSAISIDVVVEAMNLITNGLIFQLFILIVDYQHIYDVGNNNLHVSCEKRHVGQDF
jgi:hypothetical protein